MEVYLTKTGPLFGEIAIRPPGGYIMELLKLVYDFNPWEAFVAVELAEDFAYPTGPKCYGASIVLHPGVGQVTAITDQQILKSHPAIKKVHLKVKVGDQISARTGSGDDVGYILLTADNSTKLQQAIEFAEQNFKLSIDTKRL